METGRPGGSIQIREAAGRTHRAKGEASLSCSFLSFFSLMLPYLNSFFFGGGGGREGGLKIKAERTHPPPSSSPLSSNAKVTLLAAGYMPRHFSPTPQKQQGYPVNSLARQIMWKC